MLLMHGFMHRPTFSEMYPICAALKPIFTLATLVPFLYRYANTGVTESHEVTDSLLITQRNTEYSPEDFKQRFLQIFYLWCNDKVWFHDTCPQWGHTFWTLKNKCYSHWFFFKWRSILVKDTLKRRISAFQMSKKGQHCSLF